MSHPPSIKELTYGVAVGLAVAIGLLSWVTGRGLDAAAETAAEQRAVVNLNALIDLVQAAEGAGDGEVQAAVTRFIETDDVLLSARVVDIKKRRLLASTVAADQEGDLPRRLERKNKDHKAWYDRGQALRAAVDANVEEGRAWKKVIEAETTEDGTFSLAAPLASGEKVKGVVLLESRLDPPPVASHPLGALVTLLLGLALFLLAARALAGQVNPRWVAATVTLLALVAFTFFTLGNLDDDRLAVEEAVAAQLEATADNFTSAGAPFGAAIADPSTWDRDRFGEPRGILAADGAVNASLVADSFSTARGRFLALFSFLIAVGLLLERFVGLGYARRTWRALVLFREAYSYVTPAMLGMLVLVFFPFLYGITLSFTGQTLYNLNEPIYEIWLGFDNYVKVLTDFDLVRTIEGERTVNYENFYYTLFFTIIWTLTNVIFGVSVGLALALILNTKGLAMRPLYRVLLILPWAVPNYITALIWSGMFHQQFGVVNQVVQILGFEPVAWFEKPFTSYLTVLATNGWLSFPFMMVVSLGALQSIPADLYEAAKVDGATRWQQFRWVTLPALKPALVPAVILSVVWTFNQFNVIYLVSGGDPAGSTEILITQAYKLAFEQYQYGYAAAYATVIFMILLAYGTWQNRVTQATEGV